MSKRGVVVSPTISNSQGFHFSGEIDVDQLKRLLLYWDSLSYMAMGGVGPNLKTLPDLDFLHREGVLNVLHIPVPHDLIPADEVKGSSIGGVPVALYKDVQLEAQMRLAKELTAKGVIHTVAQFGDELELSRLHAVPGKVFEFKMYECLPTPGPDTSFQDVLEFRGKHAAELSQLRFALDRMRTEVVVSDDPERTFRECSERVAFSVNEIGNSMRKAKMPFGLETVKSLIEAQESYLLVAALNALGLQGLTSPISIPAATVAVGASISLVQKLKSGARKIPESLQDYAYVFRAKRDL